MDLCYIRVKKYQYTSVLETSRPGSSGADGMCTLQTFVIINVSTADITMLSNIIIIRYFKLTTEKDIKMSITHQYFAIFYSN